MTKKETILKPKYYKLKSKNYKIITRQTGEWKTTDYIIFKCSRCNSEQRHDTNFYPVCGCDMRGER